MLRHFKLFDFSSDGTPGEALHFRLFELYVAYAFLVSAFKWAGYIAHVEQVVHPLGLAQHVPLGWMLNEWVPLANACCISGLVGLGLARVWRWGYLAALGLMLFQYAARYSLGEIPHSSNLMGMAVLGFGLAHVLYEGDYERRRFALGFTYFSIGTAYMSAALCKLAVAGIYWPLGEHLSLWIYNKLADAMSKTGTWEVSAFQQYILDHRWAGTLFLGIGLGSEIAAGLVWHVKLRKLALLAIIGLHLGIFAVMGILFKSSTIALTLLALPLWPFDKAMQHSALGDTSRRWSRLAMGSG